jgi:hypothetical protein
VAGVLAQGRDPQWAALPGIGATASFGVGRVDLVEGEDRNGP